MTIRWFLSAKVRRAADMCKHVRRLLNAQRDILTAEAIGEIEKPYHALRGAISSDTPVKELDPMMQNLEKAANRWLKPYPRPEWRENVEVFLVAIAVAMAIRTFFLQPFKIPTGSMQPTLYGVTTDNFRNQDQVKFPSFPKRIWDACIRGTFYHHLVAEEDCEFVAVRHKQILRFISKQEILVRQRSSGNDWVHKVIPLWFAPDDRFQAFAGLQSGQMFRKGEDIIKLREITGDHLFVDRMTYNFRKPDRGEIIVFQTQGIRHWMMRQDQFYIKRMVAMGGETVSIGDDHHLRINDKRLDASTPRFENIYSFSGQPEESQYSGHVNGPEFFPDAETKYKVPPNHYLGMGDNTVNSSDSRHWGPIPQKNVIGKANFVYWPITNRDRSRFGFGYR